MAKFDKVDTPEKAYWLGFIWADGSLQQNPLAFETKLALKDRNHLRKMRDFLDGGLTIHEGTTTIDETEYYYAKIRTTDQDTIHSLTKRGLTSRKSQESTLPHVVSRLKPHFVRGYFDGDGSIYESGGYHTMSIGAKSESRLDTLYRWMQSVGVSGGGVYSNGADGGHVISIGARDDLTTMYETMYPNGENTEPVLERKLNRFMQYKEVW